VCRPADEIKQHLYQEEARMASIAPIAPIAQDCENFLLSTLPQEAYQSILPHLELVETPLHMVLYERGKAMQYAYFPTMGQHSILAPMRDGGTVEVGTVGFEGMASVDLLTGGEVASETTVCEVPGAALRMSAAEFKKQLALNAPLLQISLRYFQAYLAQVQQSVACNALHTLDQRFARWVLMGYNRARGQPFQLTQEYLASMLGVHRPTVSLAAKSYQEAGLVEYSRGVINVLDYAGLEGATCECYHVVKEQFERFLGKSIA
jgi:CRP-like cAMP-binding protein